MSGNNKRKRYHNSKANQKKASLVAQELFSKNDFDRYWKKHSREIAGEVYDALMDHLAGGRITVNVHTAYGYSEKQELHRGNIERFCATLPEKITTNTIREYLPQLPHVIYNALLGTEDEKMAAFLSGTTEKAASKVIMAYIRENKKGRGIVDYIRANLTELKVFRQLQQNPNYTKAAERLKNTMAAKMLLYENIQTSTPSDYTELFPLARQMSRHFILHLGPTNSGKTYQAMEELKGAKSGIYLAPLRLLAYEQYEKMNREGCPCSMITGEEQIFEASSFHQSSTIEMMSLQEEWDMAVIDEAQMVADEQRGGSWTAAILGLRAPRIHLCASPDAEKILIRMIRSCHDTYEVVYHDRKTPLEMDLTADDFRFPEDVQKGDALIVFARKDVHAVAAELQAVGVKCSIIYGSLPYDVRHREAGKFADGTTDVVVATDAIGMGMNLPIRRVVFLQTEKFDGIKDRALTASEVKQIGGRAGRYGLYETGLVTSYYDFDQIGRLLYQNVPPLKKAMIAIPEEFLSKDGKVSTILELWNQIPAEDFYDKGDISEKIKVAKALEEVEDNRELIRKFIRIPSNPDNKEHFAIFLDFYRALVEGREPALRPVMQRYNLADLDPDAKNALQMLENASAVYDLLYSFTRIFGASEDLQDILEIKRAISEKIFVILDKQKLSLRSCSICGRRLSWSDKFNECRECHARRRSTYLTPASYQGSTKGR